MFTKQHYIALAKLIKEREESPHHIDLLCKYFAKDNPRFNAKTFRLACGVKEAK